MNYLQAHYCAVFAHSVPAYITYCYGIALNKQILYCRPKRTSGGAGRLTRCRLRFHLCAFSVRWCSLLQASFRWLSAVKIRYSSQEGRECTPPEIQQKYNLHSHHAWSEAYSFHQRHCDSRSAAPFGVRISCSPLLIFSRPPLCWFKFLLFFYSISPFELPLFFHLFRLAYSQFLRYNNPKDDRI